MSSAAPRSTPPSSAALEPLRIAARSARPVPGEHAPYQVMYVAQVPPGDVLETLGRQLDEAMALARWIPPERHTYRYAPGKWSVAEVLGHVTDLERTFGLRAMCIARRDPGPFPSVEEDPYVAAAGFDSRGLENILDELQHLRRANLALFASFDDEALERRGTAAGHVISVRGLLYLTAGHMAHHLAVVRERYLAGLR